MNPVQAIDNASEVEKPLPFTPFPWIATTAFRAHTLSVRGGVRPEWPLGGTTICEFKESFSGAKRGETRRYTGFGTREKADARLISAAPDYFMACHGEGNITGLTPLDWTKSILKIAAKEGWQALAKYAEEDPSAMAEALSHAMTMCEQLEAAQSKALEEKA